MSHLPRMAERRTGSGMVPIFVDAAGRAWRVHDVTRGSDGRLRPAAKSLAPLRLFVAAGGERRLTAMRPGDVRDLVPAALQAQLGRAEMLETRRHRPRR